MLKRYITIAVLCALGVSLALNTGGVLSHLGWFALRNPATIAVTTFLAAHAPEPLLDLEQHALLYLSLGPYALLVGVIAGLALGRTRSLVGVAFWSAYSATFSYLLYQESTRWEQVPWQALAPNALGEWCTVPVFAIGAALGAFLAERRVPRLSLLAWLSSFVATALLAIAAVADSDWTPPVVFFVLAAALAVRLHWPYCSSDSPPPADSGRDRTGVEENLSPPGGP